MTISNNIIKNGWNKYSTSINNDTVLQKIDGAKYAKIATVISGASAYASLDINAILLNEETKDEQVTSEEFSGLTVSNVLSKYIRSSIYDNFSNLASQPYLMPAISQDGDNSAVVAHPISGKNLMSCWRALYYDDALTNYDLSSAMAWEIPDWLEHEGVLPYYPNLKLDYSTSADYDAIYDNHYDYISSTSYPSYGFDKFYFINTKKIEVATTTYSGALLEVRCSGDRGDNPTPHTIAPVYDTYQKPIIVQSGITMVASCLIKTANISNNNQALESEKYLNGAGFTVSFIDDTVTSTGSSPGMLQVYETAMAGGLTGTNDWTYCSIVFTPTTNVVNFRLWLKDETGSAYFSNFRMGVLGEANNLVIPTENILDNYIDYPRMNLMETDWQISTAINNGVYTSPGLTRASQDGCFQVVISGPGWGVDDITSFSGFGYATNILRDKVYLDGDIRVHDEFNEEAVTLLNSSGSLGYKNLFACAEFSNISLQTYEPDPPVYNISCWYKQDENKSVSGNLLLKMFNDYEHVEDLRLSTEYDKWLYHEIQTTGTYYYGVNSSVLFGIPQPRGISGAITVEGVEIVSQTAARQLESSYNGWTVINEQAASAGFVFPDKHERLAYYNHQSSDIAKISSRDTGKIGLKQDLDISNLSSYRLKISYKNQPYGTQNLINKSEALYDDVDWGSYVTWTGSANITRECVSYPAQLIETERVFDYNSYYYNFGYYNGSITTTYEIGTLFTMTTGSGTYYMDEIETNFHNMSSSLNGRQFVACIRASGINDKTDIILESTIDGEQVIFDSINLAGSQETWREYSIVKTFSGSPSTSKIKYTLSFDTAGTYSGAFTGVQIYETDGSLDDGTYVDTIDTIFYAPTSQCGVGFPGHIASGMYFTITLSGNEGLLYLQDDLETYSTSEYRHDLVHTSGDINTVDYTFKTKDIYNGIYSFFIGTSGNVIPETSWIYNVSITDKLDNIVSINNPISVGCSIRNPKKRLSINTTNSDENRISDGITIITSGGNKNSHKLLMCDTFNFTTNTINESTVGANDIGFEIESPDRYDFVIDDLKYGFTDTMFKSVNGRDHIEPNSNLLVFSKAGGISNLDDIFNLSHDKIISDISTTWGNNKDTVSKAIVYGTEYEPSRTAKHIVGVYQIDKKGRHTTIPFDEYATLGTITDGQRQQVLNGYLNSRSQDRSIDMNISVPINMIDYATPDGTRQAFGVVYPTVDYGNPTSPRQAGDGIMFKKGLKRFCSTMIKNPDFVDVGISGGALHWTYNGIDEASSMSYKYSKFGPRTLALTPASGQNFVWQERTWQDNFGSSFTMSCWFKADVGTYAMISAINYETGVEHFLKVEGNGEYQRIYKTLNAAHASQPIDLGTVTRSTDGTINTNVVAWTSKTYSNHWGFRIWGSTTENGGQGTGTIYYDGFNVFDGAPMFNVIDADIGSQGFNIKWDISDNIKDANEDISAFIFTKIVGFSYENSHMNAAQYYDLDIIDGAGINKTKEIEIKFLSSLHKALMIAKKEVKMNSIGNDTITLNTVIPMFFLEPLDKIKINDPNSGIYNEYYSVMSNEISLDSGDAEGILVLKKIS